MERRAQCQLRGISIDETRRDWIVLESIHSMSIVCPSHNRRSKQYAPSRCGCVCILWIFWPMTLSPWRRPPARVHSTTHRDVIGGDQLISICFQFTSHRWARPAVTSSIYLIMTALHLFSMQSLSLTGECEFFFFLNRLDLISSWSPRWVRSHDGLAGLTPFEWRANRRDRTLCHWFLSALSNAGRLLYCISMTCLWPPSWNYSPPSYSTDC